MHFFLISLCYFILLEQRISTNVVKTVGLSSRGSVRKRKHSSSDEEDSRASHLHSVVKVKDRKYVKLSLTVQSCNSLMHAATVYFNLQLRKVSDLDSI